MASALGRCEGLHQSAARGGSPLETLRGPSSTLPLACTTTTCLARDLKKHRGCLAEAADIKLQCWVGDVEHARRARED